MDQNVNRIVKLKNVRQNSAIVLEKGEWKRDIFEKEFRQAAHALQNILLANEKEESSEQESYMGKTNSSVQQRRIHTVIPFIGERGTGKTSAMQTILCQLKQYNSTNSSDLFQFERKPSFICLEPIDAGVLRGSEDIIAIVLARMLNDLRERSSGNDLRAHYQEELREIYQDFDMLYQNMSRLKKHAHFSEGESALRELQNLASSHSTAKEFRALVKKLLNYINKQQDWQGYHLEHYLVIALDDVDMYQSIDGASERDCYTLLEQVYDYLSCPGIIVLMTYNENLLKRNCSNHLRRTFYEKKHYEACNQSEQQEVKNLVQQFLAKLIADEQRIYMPDISRVNVDNQLGLSVQFPYKEGPAPFKDTSPEKGDEEAVIPVKEFILRIIAHKTGVYFDSRGKKKHFFEPRNLRELSVLIRVFEAFDDVENLSGKAQQEAYKNNRRLLLNYTYNQFAGEHLVENESNYLYRLSQQPLERQARILVDDIRSRCTASGQSGISYPSQRWQYSYGELLRGLYYVTRLEKDAYSKDLIYCILSSHSILLNQLCINARTDQISGEQVEQFLGSSIASRWANEMLPKVIPSLAQGPTSLISTAQRAPKNIGSVSLGVNSFFDFQVDEDITNSILGCMQKENEPLEESKKQEEQEKLKVFIQALALLGMFFTHYPKSGMKWTIEQDVAEDVKSIKYTMKSNQDEEVCFNVLNFAINSVKSKEYFKTISENLVQLGMNSFLELGLQTEKIRKGIKGAEHILEDTRKQSDSSKESEPLSSEGSEKTDQEMQNKEQDKQKQNNRLNELVAQYQSTTGLTDCDFTQEGLEKVKDSFKSRWREKVESFLSGINFSEMPLPLYHFDMMYNIIKRTASVAYYDRRIQKTIEVEKIWDSVATLYNDIGEELEKQDEFYNITGKGFADNYRTSWFYEGFVGPFQQDSQNPQTPQNSQIKDLFTKMMRSVLYRRGDTDAAQINQRN